MQVQELSCPHLAGLADTQSCKALLGNLQRPLSLARAGSVVDLHPVVNNGFACCALPKENPLPPYRKQTLCLKIFNSGLQAAKKKAADAQRQAAKTLMGLLSPTLHPSISNGGLLLRVLPSYAINLQAGGKQKALLSSYIFCRLTPPSCAAGSNASHRVGKKRCRIVGILFPDGTCEGFQRAAANIQCHHHLPSHITANASTTLPSFQYCCSIQALITDMCFSGIGTVSEGRCHDLVQLPRLVFCGAIGDVGGSAGHSIPTQRATPAIRSRLFKGLGLADRCGKCLVKRGSSVLQ